jgi:hypothetical protein
MCWTRRKARRAAQSRAAHGNEVKAAPFLCLRFAARAYVSSVELGSVRPVCAFVGSIPTTSPDARVRTFAPV